MNEVNLKILTISSPTTANTDKPAFVVPEIKDAADGKAERIAANMAADAANCIRGGSYAVNFLVLIEEGELRTQWMKLFEKFLGRLECRVSSSYSDEVNMCLEVVRN